MTDPPQALRWAWFARQPVAWGAVATAFAVLVVSAARSTVDPERTLGVGLLIAGAGFILMAIGSRAWPVAAVGVGISVCGALVVSDPRRFIAVVAVVGGAAGIGFGLLFILGYRRRRIRPGIRYLMGGVFAALGGLLVIFDSAVLLLSAGVVALAITVVLAAGLIEARRLGQSGVITVAQTTGLALHWLRSRVDWADDVALIHEKLLIEGEERDRRVVRYYVLMAFASAISAFGIVTDSTAVVIGAMLIAPLMTPLLAISLSLVMGWTHRLWRSLGIAAGGAMVAVVTGVAVSAAAGVGTDLATNSQIASRITPTLLDLGIALAAGAAGAYALSRHDVSDSLPGVAVAIALVPPLSVAGVAMQLGQWSAAAGAILLFLTNATAIFGMGSLTFVVTGAADFRRYEAARDGLRTWILGLVAVSVIVFGALLANGASRSLAGFRQDRAEAAVGDWIADRDYGVASVVVEGDVVIVSLAGTTVPDDTADLADALAASFGVPVTVDLRVTLQERVEVSSDN